jgi:hypothetical protein
MVKFRTEIAIDELVIELCNQLEQDELVDLIKMIDQDVADYDFTHGLKEYFVEEILREEEFLDEE